MKKSVALLTTLALLFPVVASAKTVATKAAPVTLTKTMTKTVDINRADAKTLMTLHGIGPKIAENIIKNRPYKDAKDLATKVKGLSEKNIQKLLPFISFK